MREDLPFYTVSDLKEHGTVGEGKRLWVAYRRGIYDVTDFLDKHPGGRDRLLLAVGRELDPFWRVYGQHNLDSVHELLESMRIGNLVKLEEASDSALEDAYGNEPLRHPALIVRSEKPFNAETPLTLLADDFFTPNDLFFVRNHLPVPQKLNAHSFSGVHFLPGSVQVDKEKYEVEIEVELPGGEKKRLASLSLSDLQTKFYPHHLPCALQCAGNRRDDFNKKGGRRVLNGAAVRSAMPSGQVWLNCFSHCSIGEEDARRLGIRHVHFEGHDCDPLTHTHYAASIPIHRALLGQTLGRWGGENEEDPFQSTTSFGSRDVLLVYEMNGRDLPPDHGAPVRVLVPGTVGARSVKWLKKITLSPRECGSHWQQQDYKDYGNSTVKTGVALDIETANEKCSRIERICGGGTERTRDPMSTGNHDDAIESCTRLWLYSPIRVPPCMRIWPALYSSVQFIFLNRSIYLLVNLWWCVPKRAGYRFCRCMRCA
ncbi:unnamed protein product [Neospora caninum Liverpool]|uniref:Cytochrome b5 heme-binding domain-containing protein n=1 Tax=Neospora caninum (strain Liverpool) TaxID=572307 RepID=F0V7N3_NEOCL|nr:uncharacterized protein NCLIV_002115 [Neospora caninum Liverpool]CBZ49724.1 unnamed protein product [Neospora caninum Liverpool]|eukprot:XP_003879759.1 uncharacterized protein NCLIV_002115 [Neospora caninum Liverpool]